MSKFSHRPSPDPCPRLDRRGQALVEFALVLPVLLMLAVAIMDFGRALFVYSEVSNATREAARYATNTNVLDPVTLKLDCAGIRNRARAMFTLAPTTLTPTVRIERPAGSGGFTLHSCATPVEPGDRVRVEVNATVELLTLQMIGPLFGRNGPLSLPITFVASRSLLPVAGIATGPTTTPLPFSDNPGGTYVAQTATAEAATATASAVAATATSVAGTATSVAATVTSSAATLAALGAAEQTATIAAQQTAAAVAQQTATAVVATAVAHQTAEAIAATATAVAATATAAALPPNPPINFTAACGTYNASGRFVNFKWTSGDGTTNSFKITSSGYSDLTGLGQSATSATSPYTIPFRTSTTFSIVALNSLATPSAPVVAPAITCGRPIAIAWVTNYPSRPNGSGKTTYYRVVVTDVLSSAFVPSATVIVSGTNFTGIYTMTYVSNGQYCYTLGSSDSGNSSIAVASYNSYITNTVVGTADNTGLSCP